MLSQMSPAEFEERYLLHQIDPTPDSCEALCVVIAEIQNAAKVITLGRDLLEDERTKADDLMPRFKFEPRANSGVMSAQAAEDYARNRWG